MTTCPQVGQVPGTLIKWAAGVIGIPCQVVAAQINEESGGNPGAVSPTGAQGVAQFEPGTWQGEGCTGSPFNVNDAMKCYAKYMYSLVRQFHGNVRDALAAYNAGPGHLAAGYGYADAILGAAGQPGSLAASGGTGQAGAGGQAGAAAAAGADCAFTLGGGKLGPVGLPSACLLKKSTIRHMVGGGLMVAGGTVGMFGVILLAAFAFRASGAARAASAGLGLVPTPGAQAASRAIASPQAAASGRVQRAQARARQQQAAEGRERRTAERREQQRASRAAAEVRQPRRLRPIRQRPPNYRPPADEGATPTEFHHE